MKQDTRGTPKRRRRSLEKQDTVHEGGEEDMVCEGIRK